jgi:hypothetical protein
MPFIPRFTFSSCKMTSIKKAVAIAMVTAVLPSIASATGSVQGTIRAIHAGNDNWYGVRFMLNITSNQTNGECNPDFIYTEPEPDSGHKNKVAVFTAAYLTGKPVIFYVTAGRGGFCKLLEGSTQ